MLRYVLLSALMYLFILNSYACDSNKADCKIPPSVDFTYSVLNFDQREVSFNLDRIKTRNTLPIGSKNRRFDLTCSIFIENELSKVIPCDSGKRADVLITHKFNNDGVFNVQVKACVKGAPNTCTIVKKDISLGKCKSARIGFEETLLNEYEYNSSTEVCVKSCKPLEKNVDLDLKVSGTASQDFDYSLSRNVFHFSKGESVSCILVNYKDDEIRESFEKIVLELDEVSLFANGLLPETDFAKLEIFITDDDTGKALCNGEPEINPPHPTCFVSSNSFVSPTKVSCDSRDAQICSGSGIGTLGLGIVQILGTPKVINSQLDPDDGIITIADNAVIRDSSISGAASFAGNSQFLNSEVIALPAKGIGEKAIRGVVIEGNALVEDSTIDDNATVSDNAIIKNCFLSDNAIAKESARLTGIGDTNTVCSVSENAIVSGSANLSGSFGIFGDAKVSGNVILTSTDEIGTQWSIWGNAEVSGNAQLIGKGVIAENAKVFDNAVLRPDKDGLPPQIRQNARIFENAVIEGSVIAGQTRVRSKATVAKSVLCFDETIVFNTALKVRCDPNTLPNPLYDFTF